MPQLAELLLQRLVSTTRLTDRYQTGITNLKFLFSHPTAIVLDDYRLDVMDVSTQPGFEWQSRLVPSPGHLF
jgi:hypothetical protein